MSNKLRIKKKDDTPRCRHCGSKMDFKESYSIWTCHVCGYTKEAREKIDSSVEQS